jgi:hypothetical protein
MREMNIKTHRIVSVLAGMSVIISAAAQAEEERYVTLSGGYEHTSGRYGTDSTTEIVTIPVTALYETGPWSLKLTVPYLRATGTGDVIASGGYGRRHTATTVTQTRTTQSGLGDVVTMLTYRVYSSADSDSGIDLSGKVKFGTASKTLGTGQNDYGVQAFLYRDFSGFTPNLTLGYEVLGSSDQLPLNNVYFGILGSDFRLSEQMNIGAEYKYVQKASDTLAEQRQATFYANFEIGTDVYLRGYVLKGYAAGSPDTGYGVSISAVY